MECTVTTTGGCHKVLPDLVSVDTNLSFCDNISSSKIFSNSKISIYNKHHADNRTLFKYEPVHEKTICICENKGADQLRGNREADQRLCFRYMDSTIPLLLKSEISRF